MTSMRVLLAVSVTVAVAAAPLWAAGSRGTDTIDEFPSTAFVELELTGAGTLSLELNGPVTIARQAPVGDTIAVEMLSLQLHGIVPAGRILPEGTRVDITGGRNQGLNPITGMIEDALFDQDGRLVGGSNSWNMPRGSLHFRKDIPSVGVIEGEFGDLVVETDRIYNLPPNAPVEDRPLGAVDHYKCYAVKEKGFKPLSVKLADQFESEQAQLLKPLTLCAPVSKNGEPFVRPSAHLKCYAISSSSPRPKKAEVEVGITNQFGSQELVVLQPQTLCAPTLKRPLKKTVKKPPPPRGSLDRLTEHFKCYAVRPKTPFGSRVVGLEDQFEVERARVLTPVSLCTPAEKKGVRIRDAVTHLTCYTIRDAIRRRKPVSRLVVVKNQFGVEVLTVLNPQTLCVPSKKKPPCSDYAERTKAALFVDDQQVGTLNSAIHRPYEGVKGSPCE